MNRQHLLIVAASVALALLMYFGLDILPHSQALVEKSRALNVETLDIESLKQRAVPELNAEEKNYIGSLENIIRLTDNDSVKSATMKQLSGVWFNLSYPALAGYWAKQVAESEQTAEAWSIAGSTFASALHRPIAEDIKEYCFGQAIQCFESAISLDPGNPDYRLNLAICYAEHPLQDEPMKGIMSLLELKDEFPEHPGVRFNLGRFAWQTGQVERAIQRLNEAIALDSAYTRAHCLLADVYEGTDQPALAVEHSVICEKLLNNK